MDTNSWSPVPANPAAARSRTTATGRFRRSAAVAVVACLAVLGGLLVGPPAAAQDAPGTLVHFVAPQANARLAKPEVFVALVLSPGAQAPSLQVTLNQTHDVTPSLFRFGPLAAARLQVKDGLGPGANKLVATVNGPRGRQSQDTVFFTVPRGLGGEQGGLPLPDFALRSRVATAANPAPANAYAVTVGNASHPAPQPAGWSCAEGVWVLALSRDGLNETSSTALPLCSSAQVNALTAYLKGLPDAGSPPSPPIVVVNSINTGGARQVPTPPGLSAALAGIGAVTADFNQLDLRQTAFSVFGIRGLPAGQAHSVTTALGADNVAAGSPTPASVNGNLVRDNNENFTLTMRDDAVYDVSPDGVVTINGHAYPPPAPRYSGYQGGLHVLVADRRTLAMRSDTLYETNSDAAVTEVERLHAAVTNLTEGDVVFLASVGSPAPPSFAPAASPTKAPGACPAPTYTASTVTCTYHQTGHEQVFTVPTGITGLEVTAVGAVSGRTNGGASAHGDVVEAQLGVGAGAPVLSGQPVYVEVGGNGGSGDFYNPVGGGFNGGGNGGGVDFLGSGKTGGGGGGASDVRTCPMLDQGCTLGSRLLVAGGGGGGGGSGSSRGGDGGPAGHAGMNGGHTANGGKPGTTTGGGAGGQGSYGTGASGTAGQGGVGNYGTKGGAGGGGGGGYYGGGGGGGETSLGAGGGGGGSDLVPAGGSATADITGRAQVTISYPLPGSLAQILRPLGATPNVIEWLASQPRYSLVGAISPPASAGLDKVNGPEANNLIQPGATGELQGSLTRGNRGMWYGPGTSNAPVVRTVNGQTQPPSRINLAMYDVLSPRVSAAWPVPVPAGESRHDGQVAAYAVVSGAICGCADIRTQYNVGGNTISNWGQNLQGLTPHGGRGYSVTDFTDVQAQLQTELKDVYLADGLENDLHTLLSDQNQMLQPKLQDAYKAVRESFSVDNSQEVLSVLYEVVESLAAVAEPVVEGLGPVLGVLAAVVSDTQAITTDANGAVLNRLDTTVGDLANQAARGFGASLENLNQTFGTILSDWGKLSVVGHGLDKDALNWSIHGQEATAATTMASAAELSYYRALVPLVYGEIEGTESTTSDPTKWAPYGNSTTFAGYEPGTSFYSFSVFAPDGTPRYDNEAVGTTPVLVFRDQYNDFVSGDAFPPELMKNLTDLGFYPPYLFERWPLPHKACPASGHTSEFGADPWAGCEG